MNTLHSFGDVSGQLPQRIRPFSVKWHFAISSMLMGFNGGYEMMLTGVIDSDTLLSSSSDCSVQLLSSHLIVIEDN